jgi:hypothetical protein
MVPTADGVLRRTAGDGLRVCLETIRFPPKILSRARGIASTALGSELALNPAAMATHRMPRSALRRSIAFIGSLLFQRLLLELFR